MMTKEIKILQSLDHPNVIRVLEVLDNVPHNGTWCESCACSELKSTFNGTCANCQHDTCDHVEEVERRDVLMIVQELAAGGELFGLLTQGAFQEGLARFYFRQLIAGLEHCHMRKVIHRDLKPENLVLDAAFNLKIVDFGLAAYNGKGSGGIHHSGVGSQPYTAPEVYYNKELYNSQGYRGEPADVWSCAVILYVMLKGSPPFRRPLLKSIGNSPRLRRCPHFSALMRGKGYNKISTSAKEFLQKLFVIDPSKRLTIKQIKDDPWFRGPVPTSQQVARMVRHKAREVWMEQLKPEMAEVLEKFTRVHVEDEKVEKEEEVNMNPLRPGVSAPLQIPRRPHLSPSNSYISTPPKSIHGFGNSYFQSYAGESPTASPPFISASPVGTPGTPSTPFHLPSPSPDKAQLPAILNLASASQSSQVSHAAAPLSAPAMRTVSSRATQPNQGLSGIGRSLLGNPLDKPVDSEETKGQNYNPFEKMNTTMSMLQLHGRDDPSVKRGIPAPRLNPSTCVADDTKNNSEATIKVEHEHHTCSNEEPGEVSPTNLQTFGAESSSDLYTMEKFAVHTKLLTNGTVQEIICLLSSYFCAAPSMRCMDCVVDSGAHNGQAALHVAGKYGNYCLTCKIEITSEPQNRRGISFRRIQGNTLAFHKWFAETSQAIWNR
uniref:non-specific serine/threonine protein kinase n=1 Tax=Lotharella globosa TaxID=91324 RepID=A0A7S3ZGF4_9EUKA